MSSDHVGGTTPQIPINPGPGSGATPGEQRPEPAVAAKKPFSEELFWNPAEKRNGLRIWDPETKLVAGAGFEPATFGL